MKKRILLAVMTLFFLCITCAFAIEFKKSDSRIQKTEPEKTEINNKTQTNLPYGTRQLDKNVIKLRNAVLPKVVYPTMTHHIGYEGMKFAITVRFNTDMDRSTFIAGSNVIFDFPRAANESGQITWISDREFKWVQHSERRLDICTYDPDCEFKLTLKDSILSKEGLKLDGDNDNKQGGNFTIWFIDLG